MVSFVFSEAPLRGTGGSNLVLPTRLPRPLDFSRFRRSNAFRSKIQVDSTVCCNPQLVLRIVACDSQVPGRQSKFAVPAHEWSIAVCCYSPRGLEPYERPNWICAYSNTCRDSKFSKPIWNSDCSYLCGSRRISPASCKPRFLLQIFVQLLI